MRKTSIATIALASMMLFGTATGTLASENQTIKDKTTPNKIEEQTKNRLTCYGIWDNVRWAEYQNLKKIWLDNPSTKQNYMSFVDFFKLLQLKYSFPVVLENEPKEETNVIKVVLDAIDKGEEVEVALANHLGDDAVAPIAPSNDTNTSVKPPQTKPQQPKPTKPTPSEKPSENTTPGDNSVSAFEKKVVELTNKERAKNGLKPLTLDTKLSNVAGIKSQDMLDKGYFDHNSPTYGSPFDMMSKFGVSYNWAAENIAKGQTTPEAVVNAWMNSSGHRANILSDKATHIGVGYVANGHHWTQMFRG